MDWKALIELMKRWPKVTVGVFLLGVSFGGWLLWAEICHAQTMTNKEIVTKNAQTIQKMLDLKEAEIKEKAAAKEQIAILCRAKKLDDRELCAEAGVTLP